MQSTQTEMDFSRRKSWWIAIVAGMASYLDAAAIVSTGTALVIFQSSMGLEAGQVGQLSALLTIMIAVGALIGGRLGDRFGRRHVFMVTMTVVALGALLLVFAASPLMVYIGVPLLGLATGADLPVSMSMIAESAPADSRGKMVTFSHVLWMVGILAVELIGIFFGDLGALTAQILYGHIFVIAVIVMALRFTLPESPAWTRAHTAAELTGEDINKEALRKVFSKRYLVPLIATGLFYSIANIAANTNGQFGTYLYVNVAGVSISTASTVSLIAFFVSFLGLFVLLRFVDTKWRMVLFAVCSVFTIVAFVIPALAGVTFTTLIIMAMLYSVGGAVSGEPMYKVWTQELFPTSIRSTAQGITIAATRVVAAAVALFTPSIINGGPQALFLFLTGCVAVAAAIGIFWLARIPKPADAAMNESGTENAAVAAEPEREAA